LVIVVDSISFQLPITKLPISGREAARLQGLGCVAGRDGLTRLFGHHFGEVARPWLLGLLVVVGLGLGMVGVVLVREEGDAAEQWAVRGVGVWRWRLLWVRCLLSGV